MCSRILSPKELKLKQEFEKCGLEEICASNATLSTEKNLFLVNNMALYKIKNTNNYLLFGDPMDYSSVLKQLQESAKDPEKFKQMMELKEKEEKEIEIDGEQNEVEEKEVEEVAKKVEELNFESTGMNEKDIKLIMDESKISREEAIKALKEAKNDVIQALVNLNK